MIFKKLPHIDYDRKEFLEIAATLEFSDAYAALGRPIPQQISPTFDLKHEAVQKVLKQFPRQPFYNCSFIRTQPYTKIEPHTDSSTGSIQRTVNILFPLDNYVSPLYITVNNETYTVEIDCPVAFPCSELHSYENNTDGYRTAFVLQCKKPFDMRRLEWMGVI
jgi:hypothetical protein